MSSIVVEDRGFSSEELDVVKGEDFKEWDRHSPATRFVTKLFWRELIVFEGILDKASTPHCAEMEIDVSFEELDDP